MKAIEARNLSVWVNGRAVVGGVDLDVEEGTIALITGPSGSGKTTLLKVLAGYIPNVYRLHSLSGSVKVFGGRPIDALAGGLVGYIPQDTWSFFIGRSICDELAALGVDGSSYGELCSVPMEMLSDGELYDSLLKLSLDLGVRLILVDEPSTHLDSKRMKRVMDKFRDLVDKEKLTVVVADHKHWGYMDYVDTVVEVARDSRDYEPSRSAAVHYNCCCGETILKVDNLWIRRGDKYIVKGFNLELREGEVVALYGRNGSGKTTIIKALAGIGRVERGSIRRFGSTFYIPQRPVYWFSTSSVVEELKLYSKIYSRNADTVDMAAELFNLSKIADRDPYTVSVGEARRLSLALSYIASPKMLLLDEPVLGLDKSSIEILYSYLDMVRRSGGCVVMATHSRSAADYADRVVELGVGVHEYVE
ncbi:MAG: ATP-binding cassette domain-containing protein [Ignisphaera sp.]|nr:ATP-binding cassette domain-containing protein [Ignisphaera sp.]MDW8084858.1 ATP-binding cassette domain-containing protein [Ignisphaera sp.]